MEVTFWENFCFIFAIDYDAFQSFCYNWFSVRGLSRVLTVGIPENPRVHISVPLVPPVCRLLSESDFSSESTFDDIEVNFEGSLSSSATASGSRSDLSSCVSPRDNIGPTTSAMGSLTLSCDGLVHGLEAACGLARCASTPDIVRTIANTTVAKIDSDIETDDQGYLSPGTSVVSGSAWNAGVHRNHRTGRRVAAIANASAVAVESQLEQLQRQFTEMQRAITGLVQLHRGGCQGQHGTGDISPVIPISHTTAPPPPPPPCGPPAPPAPTVSIFPLIKSRQQQSTGGSSVLRSPIDMSAVLREIKSAKLRPVSVGDGSTNSRPQSQHSPSFNHSEGSSPLSTVTPRGPPRSVSRHESIIAMALRERFNRMAEVRQQNGERWRGSSGTGESGADSSSDEWGIPIDTTIAPTTTGTRVTASSSVVSHVPHQNNSHEDSNVGIRSMLRRVDRSVLPVAVSRDLTDYHCHQNGHSDNQ